MSAIDDALSVLRIEINHLKQQAAVVGMKKPFTMCRECVHFRCVGDAGYVHIWYSHFCLASPVSRHDKDAEQYAYCRDINLAGDCPKFFKPPLVRNPYDGEWEKQA